MPANAIILQPAAGNSFALTGVTSVYKQPSAFQPIGQTVYSTASILTNANNALYGKALTISGFTGANVNNNGTFLVTSSTATTITTNNANGVIVTAAATAAFSTQGFPSQYASKVENMWSNQTGDFVTVNANTGDCLVAVVIGLKQIVNFDLLHGTAPYSSTTIGAPPTYGTEPGTTDNFQFGQLAGLNDYNATPTISDFGNGTPVDITATKLATGTTLTVTYENPNSPTNYFTSSEVVTLSGTKQPWLPASVTVASTPSATTFTATISAISFTLTESEGALVVPGQQTTTTYLGTISNGADDSYAGATVTIAGFTNSGNNGAHVVVNSSGTSITVLNSAGVAETVTGTKAQNQISEGAGAAHYIATAATANSAFNSVTVTIVTTSGPSAPSAAGNVITCNTGAAETVAAYVAAYPSVTTTAGVVNFTFTGVGATLFTAGGPYTLSGGITPASSAVTSYTQAQDTGEATPSGNTWSLSASSSLIDSDYTVSYPFTGPPANGSVSPAVWNGQITYTSKGGYAYGSNLATTVTPSSPFPSSMWSIDGYYPCIYVFTAPNVKAGTYKVNLNSMYQPGDANNFDDWAQGGVPIFDGGVNFSVLCLSGTATTAVVENFSIATTETVANPATAPGTIAVANADGDALISIALVKSGNVLAVGGNGNTSPTSLALTAVSPLNYGQPQFASQNLGGAVYTGTITGGANNALVGNHFTVTGFTNSLNNSPSLTTFVCTASTATTLTLSNGVAVAATGASGHAAYTPLMTQIGSGKLVGSEAHYLVEYFATGSGGSALTGTFNPGFNNPLGYPVLVASFAIKSS